ncbi:hypothetical protein BDQ12DRAFT_741969 [Crucibulum laeve]|uniref:Proteophosphoglycan ppg4 n=1 Tax=Crucibulum laeve TaxID=68775 RepID=A0A5C3ML66_9AGAR|nr:hypothetical protein BDQ12DRAFT_741969 [Crucibulum laeve]
MAAALQPLRNDSGPNTHPTLYPRPLMTDFNDFSDNRYPTLATPQSKTSQRSSSSPFGAVDHTRWDTPSNNEAVPIRRSFDPDGNSGWISTDQPSHTESAYPQQPASRSNGPSPDMLSLQSQSQQSQEPPRSSLSYALPPGASRRVVERYSLDDNNNPRTPSRASAETRPAAAVDSSQDNLRVPGGTSQGSRLTPPQERQSSILPNAPRHPDLPAPSLGSSPNTTNGGRFSPIMPLSASPAYVPPVSPNHRAYAQQPTYITPPTAPNPINTVYSPIPVQPQEEVCVECAMRDQDMADVDVTSPGVWDRASDVLYEELKQRELEEETSGTLKVNESSRPRAKGGRLTEQNLKIWLSINPREPASRQQTLNSYIKSQRALLEAEAIAHARAMQEAKQLDNRMRDTYSQLRRSAYDMGSSAAPADDTGGVRIKPPLSPASPQTPAHARSQSREITLLENGMIVEHVDVRKEEREARERKRKEEKRARKSSRSSAMDVTSIISAQSYGPDSGVGLKPYSRYSQSSSVRPMSVLTTPERPNLPRAYSQASFSDVHSLGSGSPRRSRFFGIRNLSSGWRSQDSLAPSGMSGSMVDMHVALQREAHGNGHLAATPIDLNTARRSQLWPPVDLEGADAHSVATEGKPKKKKGFAKIWSIVTGSSKTEASHARQPSVSHERHEDDLPLAPPPPLSYLVSRGPSNLHSPNARHASTPSLPSTNSVRLGLPSPGMSPPTAPSSALPSPTSSRPSAPDVEIELRNPSGTYDEQGQRQYQDDTVGRSDVISRNGVHLMISEPDIRQKTNQNIPTVSLPPLTPNRPASVMSREKSLPPIPPGETPPPFLQYPLDNRPRTMYTYDARDLPPGSGPAHDFLPPHAPFRTSDNRRQSFGGMSSRPNLGTQTMPNPQKSGTLDTQRTFGPHYDEFGLSRRSLGRLEHVQENEPIYASPASTKRKSKFGLSSLLGKKNNRQSEIPQEHVVHQFPPMRNSGSDGQDDLTVGGYATSTSRHSALSMGGTNSNVRMSVTSRKALEELVSQDAEFVAYRYPSNDQRLDLLR